MNRNKNVVSTTNFFSTFYELFKNFIIILYVQIDGNEILNKFSALSMERFFLLFLLFLCFGFFVSSLIHWAYYIFFIELISLFIIIYLTACLIRRDNVLLVWWCGGSTRGCYVIDLQLRKFIYSLKPMKIMILLAI